MGAIATRPTSSNLCDSYFYGTVTINISGGEITENIYGAGAGGVTGYSENSSDTYKSYGQEFDTSVNIPCVVLIDECDFIATARNSGRDIGEASRIVNMFLQLLDEYEPIGLIVATTNLKDKLDKALFRRFDESFEMVKPSLREIEKVLKMTLSSIDTSKDFDWIGLSDKMQGMSYAEIVKLAQNSAKSIILKGKHILEDKIIYAYIEGLK